MKTKKYGCLIAIVMILMSCLERQAKQVIAGSNDIGETGRLGDGGDRGAKC
ncbi:MAG: hypothetical protein AB4060_11345 [Crocosphaera sp.]